MVFDRSGVKIAVVGLASEKTISTTVSGRTTGLELVPLETAIPLAVTAAKAQGAQLNVVLIDDCFTVAKAAIDAHPEWKIDLVVGSHCDEAQEAKGANTLYFSAGAKLADYISAEWKVPGEGATTFFAQRKSLAADGPVDADLKVIADRWQAKLDAELGEKIGFTKNGFKEDSKELRTWVTTALRDQAKADAGLINRKGLRAALPKGPLTKASVYSMMPFENAVLTLKVTGAQLNALKANPEAVLVLPAKVDPAASYTLATTEYLYFGGDNFGLQALDADPQATGQMWQTPVIEWTMAKKTDEKHPLEGKLK
jgi:2',3'-cyclic-nucleotide 2'-phosphodiesterase (5'-nucleotidase family)